MWVIRFCSVVSVFVGLVFGVGCSRDLDYDVREIWIYCIILIMIMMFERFGL